MSSWLSIVLTISTHTGSSSGSSAKRLHVKWPHLESPGFGGDLPASIFTGNDALVFTAKDAQHMENGGETRNLPGLPEAVPASALS